MLYRASIVAYGWWTGSSDFQPNQEGGNTTEMDAVLRSHIVKHWKNGKFDVVTTPRTTENPMQSFVDYVDIYITAKLRGNDKYP